MGNLLDIATLITAFTTFFVVIHSIGLAPVFVALTQGMSAQKRKTIAIRACLIGFCLLALFGLFGESVLGFAGISMPAFQIAGGALLFLRALEIVFGRRGKRRNNKSGLGQDDNRDPSIFPLSTPLIAGPGAIATIILLTNAVDDNLWQLGGVCFAMFIVVLTVLALFMMSDFIGSFLRKTGVLVVSRVLGMLLAALSVHLILNGRTGFRIKGA